MNMLLSGLLGLIACGDKQDNAEDTANNENSNDKTLQILPTIQV